MRETNLCKPPEWLACSLSLYTQAMVTKSIRPEVYQTRLPDWSQGSFLGGENGNLAPWHPEPPAFAPSQSMICLAPRGCSPPLSLQSCHISFRDNLHVFVSNFNLILILYLHFPLTSPGSFMLHFGSRLGLQLLPI